MSIKLYAREDGNRENKERSRWSLLLPFSSKVGVECFLSPGEALLSFSGLPGGLLVGAGCLCRDPTVCVGPQHSFAIVFPYKKQSPFVVGGGFIWRDFVPGWNRRV